MSSLFSLDHLVFTWINGQHAPWLDPIMTTASVIGVGGSIWLAIAALLLFFPDRRAGAWRIALTIGFSALMVDGVVKPLVWRDRPFAVVDHARVIAPRPPSSSFPSGHAANAVAGAIAVSSVVPGARVVWWLVAATIALSRIYVGVHFPIDVLAGALLGAACAWFTLRHVKPHGAPFAPGPVPGA